MILRGAVLWPVLRAAAIFVAGAARGVLGDLPGSGISSPNPFAIVLLSAIIAWVDLQRRDEVLFFANLGVGIRTLILLYVAPVFALECVVALLQ